MVEISGYILFTMVFIFWGVLSYWCGECWQLSLLLGRLWDQTVTLMQQKAWVETNMLQWRLQFLYSLVCWFCCFGFFFPYMKCSVKRRRSVWPERWEEWNHYIEDYSNVITDEYNRNKHLGSYENVTTAKLVSLVLWCPWKGNIGKRRYLVICQPGSVPLTGSGSLSVSHVPPVPCGAPCF